MPTDRFEDALQKITYDFAMQVVELIRSTTLDELTRVTQLRGTEAEAEATATPEQPAKRRGRPPKKAVATVPVEAPKVVEPAAAEPTTPAKKAKKARAWPICSVEGCGKKMYPGSGKIRLCYGHHLDAGGKPTPLVEARKKAAAKTEAGVTPAPEAATEAPKAPEVPKAAKAAEAAKAPKSTPKKRPWPTCSVKGCTKNVYMPSGAKKMCYQHNLEHGGKPTPLAKVNKARKAAGKAKAKGAEAPKAPEAEKPKTIRRKKADKAEK